MPVATMPPGVTPHVLDLSNRKWTLTKEMQRVQRSPGASPQFQYTGTGNKAGSEYASLVVPVNPGTIYMFSARADLAHVIGQADLIINRADGKISYVSVFENGGASTPKIVKTPAWKCPPGVTQAFLAMQIAQSAVENGRNLTFTEPKLTYATPLDESSPAPSPK